MSLFTQTDIVVCDAAKLKSPRPDWPEDYQDLSFAMQRGDGIAGEKFNKMVEEKNTIMNPFLSDIAEIGALAHSKL